MADRPEAWEELRDANPERPLDARGNWAEIDAGNVVRIPAHWPEGEHEVEREAGDLLDDAKTLAGRVLGLVSPQQPPESTEPAEPDGG